MNRQPHRIIIAGHPTRAARMAGAPQYPIAPAACSSAMTGVRSAALAAAIGSVAAP